jgi:hypothetical protein
MFFFLRELLMDAVIGFRLHKPYCSREWKSHELFLDSGQAAESQFFALTRKTKFS